MKILLVNSYYYPNIVGGAEISVQILSEYLASESNEVYVLCVDKNVGKEIINNVNVIRMPVININLKTKIGGMISRYLINHFNIFIYKKYKNIIKEMAPNIIHTNNLYGISPLIWKIANKLNIPIVHTARDYSLFQRNWGLTKISKVYTKMVKGFIAPSEFTLKYYTERGFFKKCILRKVVHNSIVYDECEYLEISKRKIKQKSKKIKFAFLGRYEENKGVLWLIETFQKIGNIDYELYLFGGGSLEKKIIDMITNLDNIFEEGFLQSEELYRRLKEIDVIIVPSLWDEPFGRVILDAYCNMIPVIVTNRGGMPELVENERTGKIIECNTTELENAINFYGNRENIINTFEFIDKKFNEFSVEKQIKEYTSIYNKLIKESGVLK